jgi:hypothetical protein
MTRRKKKRKVARPRSPVPPPSRVIDKLHVPRSARKRELRRRLEEEEGSTGPAPAL